MLTVTLNRSRAVLQGLPPVLVGRMIERVLAPGYVRDGASYTGECRETGVPMTIIVELEADEAAPAGCVSRPLPEGGTL